MEKHKYVFTYKYDQGNGTYIEDFTLDSNKSEDSRSSFFQDEYEQVVDLIENKVNKDNNLILFTGRRGAGKTSAMCSIKNYLEKSGESRDKLQNYRFFILPVVDPSYFDQKTNILKVVLSSMFKEAKKIFQKSRDSNNGYEKLLESFNKAFTGLGSIETADKGKYTLETLNEYSDAIDMKDTMQKLVNRFVEFWNNERFKQSNERNNNMGLVLIIDDVDMNVSYAAAMLEQIRKYLMLDHLVILMSANLGQLHNELIEYYCSAFQKTLKDANQSLMIEVEDLATKFLLKMIPASHRIHVENPAERLLETELQIVNKKNETRNGPFQKMILTMIWERTRLLFFPKGAEKGGNAIVALHPIIPTNLRELSYFLEMLISLEPLEYCADNIFKDMKAYERCKKNFYKFKDYFLKNWIPNRLSADEEWAFKDMPSDITEINKHLINSINIIGTKHKKWLMSREMDIDTLNLNGKIDHDIYTMVSPNDPSFEKANEISDIKQQSSNCSYGDLLFMIDKYETYFESKEDRYFSDAIRIFYSMLLFETMFFNSTNVKYKVEETRMDEFVGGKELDKMVVPIQRLIGGTVYYPYHFKPVFSKYFENVELQYEKKSPFYHNICFSSTHDANEKCPLFSILYYGSKRPDRYEGIHVYDTTFAEDAAAFGTMHIKFDILSMLNNTINPWHTVFRSKKKSNFTNAYALFEREWKERINNWAKLCSFEDSNIVFPNSILPFYSVDMMLVYLRDSITVSDILGDEQSETFELLAYVAENYTLWFEEEFVDSNNIRNKIIEKCANNVMGLYLPTNTKKHAKDKMSDLVEKYKDALLQSSNISEEVFPNEFELLRTNLEALGYVFSQKKSTENTKKSGYKKVIIEKVKDLFKQHDEIKTRIIAELENISDDSAIIYDYLVKTLWRDAIMDIAIRQGIQDKLHGKGVVKFYELLRDKTKCIMECIDIDNAEYKVFNPYGNIFSKACEAFIENNFKPQNKPKRSN